MKLNILKQTVYTKTRRLAAGWTIENDTMDNKKWTWRDELTRHKGSFMSDFKANYDIATESMKSKYPGNYVVEEYYDSRTGGFGLRLKFDTPEDETFFLLQNE